VIRESAVLAVREIQTYYGTSHILQGVSIDVAPGRIVTVLGRNGAGKTTLIRSIMGTTAPRAGSIRYGDAQLDGLAPYEIARRGIALVPQGRRIFPALTVREHLDLGRRTSNRAPGAGGWTLERVFATFPVLANRQKQLGITLSGGEQQMLACARALLANPTLLLMDEPSEGLAPQKVHELGVMMEELKRSGLAVLLVEQKLSFAMKYADHAYVLAKGQIAYDGSPAALASDRALLEQLLGVAPS
jgi:branched-chain amino acid transport system ATP-binding protein